jgi:GAF domain-containing protein
VDVMQDDRDAEIAHLKSALAAAEQRESITAERAVRAEIERDAALEQQTATAEVLRTIARAPTDVQPVLDALILRAMHLSASGGALLAIRDGHHMRFMADAGGASPGVSFRTGGGSQVGDRVLLTRDRPNGRAILDGRTIHIPDGSDPRLITEYPESTFPFAAARLHVPLLRGRESIGSLTLFRDRARPFSDRAIALLETFADQAVIAIENARLFQELGQRNAELQESNRQVSETLEQQTVTAEVLRVIAASPSDLDRVLTAVAESAARLCEINDVVIFGV